MKVARHHILSALDMSDNDPSKLTLSKGIFTLRKAYFWGSSEPVLSHFTQSIATLESKGFVITVEDYGTKFVAFNGGDDTKKGSHYWVKFKAAKE